MVAATTYCGSLHGCCRSIIQSRLLANVISNLMLGGNTLCCSEYTFAGRGGSEG